MRRIFTQYSDMKVQLLSTPAWKCTENTFRSSTESIFCTLANSNVIEGSIPNTTFNSNHGQHLTSEIISDFAIDKSFCCKNNEKNILINTSKLSAWNTTTTLSTACIFHSFLKNKSRITVYVTMFTRLRFLQSQKTLCYVKS